jgi:hypothetical protein
MIQKKQREAMIQKKQREAMIQKKQREAMIQNNQRRGHDTVRIRGEVMIQEENT